MLKAVALKLQIDSIKTGALPDGTRVGMIFAPAAAPAGSLQPFVQFCREHGLKAYPGYYGPQKNHVLRISGFASDAALLKLLGTPLQEWQRRFGAKHPAAAALSFEEAEVTPLNVSEHFPHVSFLGRFIKENASTLTGMVYSSANIALMLSGLLRHKNGQMHFSPDRLQVSSSLCYLTSSMLLTMLAPKADHPREAMELIDAAEEDMKKSVSRYRHEKMPQRLVRFVEQHPWEISSIATVAGAGCHLLSASGIQHPERRNLLTAVSAAGTLTAGVIAATVHEDSKAVIDDLPPESPTLRRLRLKEQDEADEKELRGKPYFYRMLHERPLRVAAMIQAAANVGYGMSALRDPANPDRFMAAMSGLSILGNAIQSQALKQRGPSFDDLTTNAATVMLHDMDFRHAPYEKVARHAEKLAATLSHFHEVFFEPDCLSEGIVRRYYDMIKTQDPEKGLSAARHFADEKEWLKASPFLSHLERRELLAPAACSSSDLEAYGAYCRR